MNTRRHFLRLSAVGMLSSLNGNAIVAAPTPARAGRRYATGLRITPPGKPLARPMMLSLGDGIREDELPERVVLDTYLPPVGIQGKQGSCVGWSMGYYAFTYAVARRMGMSPEDVRRPEHQFSPAFIYGLRPDRAGGGMELRQASEILEKYGCVDMKRMPYSDSAEQEPDAATREAAQIYARGQAVSIYEAKSSDDVPVLTALKAYLAAEQLPVVIGIPLGLSFHALRGTASNYVYAPPASEAFEPGGHAITMIGYDRKLRAFRLVNSWGTSWADHGFVWVSEDHLEALLRAKKMGLILVRPAGPIPLGGGSAQLKITREKLAQAVRSGQVSGH